MPVPVANTRRIGRPKCGAPDTIPRLNGLARSLLNVLCGWRIFALHRSLGVGMSAGKRVLGPGLGAAILAWSCACSAQVVGVLPMRPKFAESSQLRSTPPVSAPSRSAPFVARFGDAPPDLLPLGPQTDTGIPGSCARAGDSLCYDYRQGRVVYKPARRLMPEIAGLRRESLSVKRDKVTLNYSFK